MLQLPLVRKLMLLKAKAYQPTTMMMLLLQKLQRLRIKLMLPLLLSFLARLQRTQKIFRQSMVNLLVWLVQCTSLERQPQTQWVKAEPLLKIILHLLLAMYACSVRRNLFTMVLLGRNLVMKALTWRRPKLPQHIWQRLMLRLHILQQRKRLQILPQQRVKQLLKLAQQLMLNLQIIQIQPQQRH